MRRIKSPALVSEVLRLRALDTPWPDVASRVSKLAGEAVSVAAVRKWADEAGGTPSKAREPNTLPAAPPPLPPTPPRQQPSPVAADDAEEMDGPALLAWIASGIRQAQADADACRMSDDSAGAGRAMKLAASLAQLLAKERARMGEDTDVVRVKASEMAEAAERARAKLHDLAGRLSAERGR